MEAQRGEVTCSQPHQGLKQTYRVEYKMEKVDLFLLK